MSLKSRSSRVFVFVLALISIPAFAAITAGPHLGTLLPHLASALPGGSHLGALRARFAGPQNAGRITLGIDGNNTVKLGGNTRPEATAKNDRGRVSDALPLEHMHLILQRSPEQEQEAEKLAAEQTDRTSPNYHHWLTAEEFGSRFGVAQEDIDTVTGWLESHGFHINQVYTSHMAIDFSGTAGQVREAFHTEIHNLDVNGEPHISNMSDPQIPRALAPVVKGIFSLHDFKPHAMNKPIAQYTFAGCNTSTDFPTEPGECLALTPQDNQIIYNLTPLYNNGYSGQGQTIAVVEDSNSYSNDFSTYRTAFGLSSGFPAGNLVTVHPGGCTNPGTNADDSEADIDVEVATAFAPSATIELISCPSGTVTFGGLIALQNLINAPGPYPGVVSVSYGVCEAFNGNGGNQAFYNTYQQAALEGIAVFGASGDEGPSSCSADFNTPGYQVAGLGISGWTSTPYNVSVGGTDFEDVYNNLRGGLPFGTYWNGTNSSIYGSVKSYVPEMPWDDSCANALISEIAHSSFVPYGSGGTCNTSPYNTTSSYLSTGAASGGASNCFSGAGGTDAGADGISDPECQGLPKPSWQSAYGVPADGVRDIPDVSMFAANGDWGHYEIVCFSDTTRSGDGAVACTGAPSTWSGFGGTSVAAPTMAAIQALTNQVTGITWGNVVSNYYTIGQSEYGTQGGSFLGSSCNSSGAGGPASTCVFNDVTQGDIDVACEDNGTLEEAHCYKPSGTYGVDSTDVITAGTVLYGGSGYISAPTCAIYGPTNNQPYVAPTLGGGGTLWAGGTQASCTAAINAGTNTAKWTVVMNSTSGVGDTIILTNPSGSTTCGPYTLSGSTTTLMASGLVTSIGSSCSLASATSSTKTVTITAKTAGTAGNFITEFGTANEFNAFYVYITNTVLGEGPNYVSGITITNGGSGYQPETPIALIANGPGVGALAVANTSFSTAASTYQPAYGAAPGYDLATGLGTVNANNLVIAFLPTQTITFSEPAPATAENGTNFNVAASASSGQTVAFTASGVCSVVDNLNGTAQYTMTASSGTCDVIANQAGIYTYQPAPTVTEMVTAEPSQQTGSIWSINAPGSAVYASSFMVSATADNNTVTPSFTAGGVCSVVDHGNGTATYTMTSGTGICTVTANAAADSGYTSATSSETTNAALATPTTTFTGAPTSAAYNTTFGVTSTTNASTTAAITASGGACSVPPNTFGSATVTMTSGTGTCYTQANWAADSNYTGAVMDQTTTATLATPTVTFTGAPQSATYGNSFSVSSSTNDGTQPVYTSAGSCSNAGNSYTMTAGTGTCMLTVSWPANSNYSAASANQSTNALQAVLTVTSTNNPNGVYGQPIPSLLANYTITGFVPGDNQGNSTSGQPSVTTTATQTSPPTTYMILVTQGSLTAANYTFTFNSSGLLTINQAATSTSLASLNYSLNPGQSTTLTATVSPSPAGAGVSPSGSVTFYLNGNALTPTGTLSGPGNTSTATYTLSASQLSGAGNSLYAAYPSGPPDGQGDTNYLGSDSSSTPISITLGSNYLSFGSVNVGSTATGMTLTYNFIANETLSEIHVVTNGAKDLDFANGGGGTCTAGTPYTTGESCTVNVSFTPSAPGVRAGAVKLYATGMTLPLATFYIVGWGESGAATVDPGTVSGNTYGSNAFVGVALDGFGNAYTSDGSGDIYEFAAGANQFTNPPTAVITSGATVAGAAMNSAGGLAVDGAGNLYITDPGNNRVVVVPSENGTLNTADASTVASGTLSSPSDVKVDSFGDVYIVDTGDGQIVEVPVNGSPTYPLTGLTNPTNLALYEPPVQNHRGLPIVCFVSSAGSPGQVNEYNACSGGSAAQIGSGVFVAPAGLAVDASFTLYVADSSSGTIYEVASPPTGTPATLPASGLVTPNGLALDGAGDLFIADGSSSGTLVQVNRTQPQALTFPNEQIGNASPPQTVTVTNIGNQALTASNLAVPTNFIQVPSGGTDCSGSTSLGSAQACEVAIEFDPTGTGSDSGYVTLTDNALNNSSSTQSVAVSGNGSQDSQTITFTTNAPSSAVYATSFGVAASASSGLTVAFTASGVCSVVDNLNGTATYTMTSGTGSCTVMANQAGNSQYAAATQVTENTAAALATPTVTYTGAPASAAYGTTFKVTAHTNASTQGMTSTTGSCTNVFRDVTMTSGTGTCNMTATWAADQNYTGATAMQTTTASLATPTVTFTGAPSSATYGTGFTVASTTNASTTAVITSSGACSNVNTSVTMTSGTGTCSLLATWAADSNYSGTTATQSTAAQLATPTVTFTGAPNTEPYNGTFTVTATTNDGPARHRPQGGGNPAAITASGSCSVPPNSQNTALVTMTSGTGTCNMTATWQADQNYTGATLSQSTTASLATPTVTFTGAPTSATYGTEFTVASTTNASTGAVITSSGACTNSQNAVTMTSGTGTCSLLATWAADSNYSGTTMTQSTAAQLATPTVTFTGAPSSEAYNGTFTVTATTNDGPGRHRPQGGGNPAAITASGACSVPANSQNTALVTMTSGTGTCNMTATWQADQNYTGATATQTTNATLATPTVTFTGAPTTAAYGANFTVASTTTASTTAVITSSGACSNANTSVTMTSGTGTCGLLATWAADSNYSGTTATQSTAASKATQSVTFTGAPASAGYGSTFGVTATTNDTGNPGVITASGGCTVPANSQNSATVTMTSGTTACSLTATWASDANYNSATMNQSTSATKGTQSVTFTGAPASAGYGSTFGVTATTNDTGNPGVITASGGCTVPANSQNSATVTMTSGTTACSLTATWASDANYNSATKNQSTSATKANQSVTFTGAPASAADGSTFTVTATTNDTGNPGVITASGACSVPANSQNSALVTMTSGTGVCSMSATWASDANYNSASASQSTNATLTTPTVTFTGAPATEAFHGRFTVTATTNSGASATITVSGVCSITSGGTNTATVQMTSGAGACSLAANWPANGNYTSATASQSTTATLAKASITLASSPDPSIKNQKVTFSSTVNGANQGNVYPSGTITFQTPSGKVFRVVTLALAHAVYTTTTLPVGTTDMEAVYSGDANYAAGKSIVVAQKVNQ